uniref:INCENP_ARK-bind domain-containing protein n=1 Tax=Syphacia muris TaxID=451379 RepID=A0A0N5AN14_9BILA
MTISNGTHCSRLSKKVVDLLGSSVKSIFKNTTKAVSDRKGHTKTEVSVKNLSGEEKKQVSVSRSILGANCSYMEWDAKFDSGIHMSKTDKEITSTESKNISDLTVLKSTKENYGCQTGTGKKKEYGDNSMSLYDGEDQLMNSALISSKCVSKAESLNVLRQGLTGTKIVKENYDISSLCSSDETDDEENPKKKIPSWAKPVNLQKALIAQHSHPPKDLATFFGRIKAPNLTEIFSAFRNRYYKRTSSARWSSPLTNPREGFSLYSLL